MQYNLHFSYYNEKVINKLVEVLIMKSKYHCILLASVIAVFDYIPFIVCESHMPPPLVHPGPNNKITNLKIEHIDAADKEKNITQWTGDFAKFHVPDDAHITELTNNAIHTEPTLFVPEKNRGHGIEYTVFKNTIPNSKNYIIFNNTRYTLYQFHLHTPADHIVNGDKAPAELHIIYKNKNGDYLVLGILFDLYKNRKDPDNDHFNRILEIFENILDSKKRTSHSIDSLLPFDRHVYHFAGTTTVPPLLHDVQWCVFTNSIPVTKHQLRRLLNLNIVLHHPAKLVPMKDVTEEMDV